MIKNIRIQRSEAFKMCSYEVKKIVLPKHMKLFNMIQLRWSLKRFDGFVCRQSKTVLSNKEISKQ